MRQSDLITQPLVPCLILPSSEQAIYKLMAGRRKHFKVFKFSKEERFAP